MESNKNTLLLGVVFFIIVNIGLFTQQTFYKPMLYASDYLENASSTTLKSFMGILSESYYNLNIENATYFHNSGDTIQSQTHWINSIWLIYISVFIIGGLVFYSLLYRSKLVPRWISVWGLIADIILLVASILSLFYSFSTTTILLVVSPIVIQEVVMAIWLIVKGFNESVGVSRSAEVNI